MPGNYSTVTASSAGTAATVALDWMAGGPTTVKLTSPSTTAAASAGGTVQFTLNDIVTTKSSLVLWSGLSSQSSTFGSTATAVVLTASALIDTQFVFQIQTPIAALRFNCSAFSSGGVRMETLQGRGW